MSSNPHEVHRGLVRNHGYFFRRATAETRTICPVGQRFMMNVKKARYIGKKMSKMKEDPVALAPNLAQIVKLRMSKPLNQHFRVDRIGRTFAVECGEQIISGQHRHRQTSLGSGRTHVRG